MTLFAYLVQPISFNGSNISCVSGGFSDNPGETTASLVFGSEFQVSSYDYPLSYPPSTTPFTAASTGDYFNKDVTVFQATSSTQESSSGISQLSKNGSSVPSVISEDSGTTSPRPSKRSRANVDQLHVLNSAYKRTPCPSKREREELARELEMSPRSVQIWLVRHKFCSHVFDLLSPGSRINGMLCAIDRGMRNKHFFK